MFVFIQKIFGAYIFHSFFFIFNIRVHINPNPKSKTDQISSLLVTHGYGTNIIHTICFVVVTFFFSLKKI